MSRAIAGVVVAGTIALVAKRARSLTAGGAIAATIVGAVAVADGWDWGAVLVIYFVLSTILSHIGRAAKERRTAAIVAKGGARDAVQVLANGGVFAGAAIAMLVRPDVHWIALAVGSLAASAADTWATEVGTLWGGEPRSVLTWRRVPAGTSGGVSLIGTMAAIAGASFIAGTAMAFGWTSSLAADIALGGIAGALVDSLLGATVQARRWCDACNRETERMMHDCGAPTHARRGFAWLDNDVVNFLSTAAGGLVAAAFSR